tara:strand:- start:516 stop:761 length:246 start_codon:yes stop_codon:yes gene_type:complete
LNKKNKKTRKKHKHNIDRLKSLNKKSLLLAKDKPIKSSQSSVVEEPMPAKKATAKKTTAKKAAAKKTTAKKATAKKVSAAK